MDASPYAPFNSDNLRVVDFAMAHDIDGYSISFTHRGSWKANVKLKGEIFAVAPVTWTAGFRMDRETKERFQQVWFQDPAELQAVNESRKPFVVAVAEAVDYSVLPRSVKRFTSVFRVVPTGRIVDEHSLETKVLERLHA